MSDHPVKYVFVTGGVVSGLGKGITAASLGTLLKARGWKVFFQKCDPYINVDPGHDEPVPARRGVRHRRRRRDRPGPRPLRALHRREPDPRLERHHRRRLRHGHQAASAAATTSGPPCRSCRTSPTRSSGGSALVAESGDVDVVIAEIGGTVGDIESLPFLEAIRQLPIDVGRENAAFIHLTLVPYIEPRGELKTKPTQHSVNELRRIGIEPDVLVCRSETALSPTIRKKIALFASMPRRRSSRRATSTTSTRCRSACEARASTTSVFERLGLPRRPARPWRVARAGRAHRAHCEGMVRIALVGKYVAAAGRLPVGRRGAQHAASSTASRWRSTGSTPRPRADDLEARARPTPTASWSPAASAARHRGQDRRRAVRPRAAACRIWGSASGCRWR